MDHPQSGSPAAFSIQARAVRGYKRTRAQRRAISKAVLLYIIALPILGLMVLPYVYLLVQSLAPWDQVDKDFFPSSFSLHSYQWVWTGGGFLAEPWLNAFFNSLLVTTVDSASVVILGAIVGYALSLLRFRGQRVINNFLLFQMFYPAIILLVPTFLVIRVAGLYNSYWAMILPKLVDLWAIFMYTSFFRSVPLDVIEAARMDGASELTIIFRIVLPLARSITTVVFLFVFMNRWTELLWDLVVVKDPPMQTLNVLLATLFRSYAAYPGPQYAASVMLTLPLLVLFLAFSRNFVRGIQFVFR